MTSSWGPQRTAEHRSERIRRFVARSGGRATNLGGPQAKGLGPLGAEDPAGISGHITSYCKGEGDQ